MGEGDIRGVLANGVEDHLLLGKVEFPFIAEGLVLVRGRASELALDGQEQT